MRFARTIVIAGALLLAAAGPHAGAQGLSSADQAQVAQIEAYINRITTFKADFIQIAPNGATARGTLWMSRPGRLRCRRSPRRRPRPCACSDSIPLRCRGCWRGSAPSWIPWLPPPARPTCQRTAHRPSTCSPMSTEPRRCVSLRRSRPPHHNDHAVSEGEALPHGRVLRIGVGGPVGSGKTALVAALCRTLSTELTIGVVTNDIYTTEDADFLKRQGILPDERIRAVQTGACPHTAIRDDITPNLDAVEDLEADHPDLDLVLVESGGDNLTATFSYGLVHRQIFVIDVAGGDKVPRKGGPGVTRSDLLVINKTDLAPLVGADLSVMDRDAGAVRNGRPTLFTSLAEDPSAQDVAEWVRGLLA